MIFVAIVLTLATSPDALASFRAQQSVEQDRYEAVNPENWTCADPLIARNFSQSVDPKDLALRITDECARPYRARPVNDTPSRAFEERERLTYRLQLEVFQLDVEAKIQQARRRATIKLN